MAVAMMDAKVEPTCGDILKQQRESLSLELSVVAAQLKLPVSRLHEIETSELDATVSATFYRGYIRSYARLVKLDPQPLLENFNQTLARDIDLTCSPSLGEYRNRKELTTQNRRFKWVSFVIVLLILGAVGWGFKERFARISSTEDSAQAISEIPLSSMTKPLEDPDKNSLVDESSPNLHNTLNTKPVPSSATEIDHSQSSGTESKATQPEESRELSEPVPQSITIAEKHKTPVKLDQLVLAFVGDCWVDIRDATGERLAFGLKTNGKVMTLQGKPPFKVLLGDPSVVNLKHNQKTVDLSRYAAGRSVTLEIN